VLLAAHEMTIAMTVHGPSQALGPCLKVVMAVVVVVVAGAKRHPRVLIEK